MEENTFLAFDIGATSGRAVLMTFSKDQFEMKEIHRFSNGIMELHGRYYWDIYHIYKELKEALCYCRKENIHLTSIGIDTWGVDFGLLGVDGVLLALPRAYRDPFTEGVPEKFFQQRMSQMDVYKRTGIQIMNFNSLFQLYQMKQEHYSPLEQVAKALFIPDLLSYLLTGKMVCEYTDASTAQLVNPYTKEMDADLLRAAGVPTSLFEKVVFPGTVIGSLTESLNRETGVGAIPVIAVAGHDTASAVAAVPTTDRNFAYLSSGTWSLMGIETEEPIISEESYQENFTNEGGVEGTIRLLKNICGMWLLERCRINWEDTSYPDLIAEAEASEPFRNLICPDDKVFDNPANMEETIKKYCKDHNQPAIETRGQLVRCIFESLALRYRQVLENLQRLSPNPIEVLHVIGGGSRNDLLNQWTANAIGIPVVAGPSEATAIGNIMIQAVAAGQAADIASMRQLLSHAIHLKTFYPEHKETWDVAYLQFKTITQ